MYERSEPEHPKSDTLDLFTNDRLLDLLAPQRLPIAWKPKSKHEKNDPLDLT